MSTLSQDCHLKRWRWDHGGDLCREGGKRGVGPSRGKGTSKWPGHPTPRVTSATGANVRPGAARGQILTSIDRKVEDLFRWGEGDGGCDEGYLCPPHAEGRRSLQDDAEATRQAKKGKKRVEEGAENGVDATLKRNQRHRIDSPAVVPAHGPDDGSCTQHPPRDFSVVLQSMLRSAETAKRDMNASDQWGKARPA